MLYLVLVDREHVVDLIPNLWVLDNRIITGIIYYHCGHCLGHLFHIIAGERRHVSQFFHKSETSPQPVVSIYTNCRHMFQPHFPVPFRLLPYLLCVSFSSLLFCVLLPFIFFRLSSSVFCSRSSSFVSPLPLPLYNQWRKASERVFVPTFMKHLLVNGVFGKKVRRPFHLMYTH